MDNYRTNFAFVQIHRGDDYETDWANDRWAFYSDSTGYPSTYFDGTVKHSGSHTYSKYESEFLSRAGIPTDVTIQLAGEPTGVQTYRVTANVCVESGGSGKVMRIYMVQVLDNWPLPSDTPPGVSYSRNGFKQAALTKNVSVAPDACKEVTREFTFDGVSWSRRLDIKIVAWAQEPQASSPPEDRAEVFQAAVLTAYDCNGNGTLDEDDIAGGTSGDCNTNGVPDECESDADCNSNGIRDFCDLAGGSSADCNANSIPDECDIAAGTSQDCDIDVIPDECEPDCNANDIADDCDITDGTSADADSSGIPDECEAPTLFVNHAATGGDYGTTWEDAYNDPQSALRIAAAPGTAVTEIWVAAGTYRPDGGTGDRTLSFTLVNGAGLYGGFAGGETDLAQRDPAGNVCVLSADLNGDDGPGFVNNGENSHHVITAAGTDATAVLDGFIVTGGNADSVDFPHYNGGGILNDNGGPTITQCIIAGNSATTGGGLYNDEGTPTLINCVVAGNRGTNTGGGFYNTGTNAHLALDQCALSGNTADGDGGGLYSIGSGADVTLTNCSLARNTAGAHGGGVRSFYAGVTTLTNCILWANTDGGPTDESAQIKVDGTTAAVVNYTCIQYLTGGLGGTGNISGDPWFIDPDGPDNLIGTADDNLRRGAGSASTDAGDNSAASQPSDADGSPRFVEDPMAPDIGAGTPPLVDMGPYEYQDDCNTNGIIDSVDLDAGTSQDCNQSHVPDECETISGGDFDGDGDVGLVDFAALAECMAGPEATPDPQLPECVPACLNAFDFEPDGDVDLGDFVEFQQAFAEP